MLPSFIIGSTSVVLAYCIGFPLGVECARRKNRPFDNFNNVVNIFLYAIPALLIVLIIMYIGSPSILHIPSN
jgi:ABC-type dipeptide/oligopeptide/nickel transport system permease component